MIYNIINIHNIHLKHQSLMATPDAQILLYSELLHSFVRRVSARRAERRTSDGSDGPGEILQIDLRELQIDV